MNALSRRRVFLGGAAIAVGAAIPVPVAAHPDAELLAACAEFGDAGGTRTALFDANEELYAATGHCDDVPEELLAPLHARMNASEEAVIDIEAKTMAGVLARARAIAAASPDAIDPNANSSGRDEAIARAVIRDLLAVTGGGA